MAKVVYNQTNFSAGEITPNMKGRVDVSRYQNGAETVENGIPTVHGGVKRRGGLRFLAEAKLSGQRRVRLMRYVFNADQAYMLEFGHLYVRIFTADGAVVLDSALNPIELVSPYTEDQLYDITRKQGGDTMILFHIDVPTQLIRRAGPDGWTIQPAVWTVQPFAEIGHMPDVVATLNDAGAGAGRTLTTSAATVPGAPVIGAAEALNGGARVNFSAPPNSGGSGITSYQVTASPGGATANGTRSPIVLNGLANGTAYTFTVRAINKIGASAPSAASNSVTPNASAPSGALAVTMTPTAFSVNSYAGARPSINGPTVSVAGATGAIRYEWIKLSGDVDIRPSVSNQAQLLIYSNGYGRTNYMSVRCIATDDTGATGYADGSVAVAHTTYPPGGGNGGGLTP